MRTAESAICSFPDDSRIRKISEEESRFVRVDRADEAVWGASGSGESRVGSRHGQCAWVMVGRQRRAGTARGMEREARGGGAAASRCAAWCVARGAGVMARSRGLPRVGLPDAAPCAAMRGARRRPRKTLSVCYLPRSAPRRWRGGASWEGGELHGRWRPSIAPLG